MVVIMKVTGIRTVMMLFLSPGGPSNITVLIPVTFICRILVDDISSERIQEFGRVSSRSCR